MKNWRLLTAIVACSLMSVSQTAAQDGAAGEDLYQSVCRNCHGPGGKGMASFPKLVGYDVDHIVSRLESYRAGEKVGSNSALMYPVAAELTDEDIANLATYITEELE
jgi:cytochrome c553